MSVILFWLYNKIMKFLLFLIIMLIILFIIVLVVSLNCVQPKETFTSLVASEVQMKDILRNSIKNDLNSNIWNWKGIKEYYSSNKEQSVMVIIKNGKYSLEYSHELRNDIQLEKFIEFMNELVKLYPVLPDCIFVHTFGDGQNHKDVPIFQNSVGKDSYGIMSSFWWIWSNQKIDEVLESRRPWILRTTKAIWRGAPTGQMDYPHRYNNRTSRRYIVDTSTKHSNIIDAKFVKSPENINYPIGQSIRPIEQCDYKYIISVDGHGGTYGLYWMFASGSCLLYNSNQRQWFSPIFTSGYDMLEFNDTPIGNGNVIKPLENLVNYAIKNDKLCQTIAENSRSKAKILFSKKLIFWYFHELLKQYSELYNTMS